MNEDAPRPYNSAIEQLRDELSLVMMFIARAIARGRDEGWLGSGHHTIDVSDAELVTRFGVIESRVASTHPPLPMEFLRRRLDLTLSEQRVLWTLIGYEVDRRLRGLLDHLNPDGASGVSVSTLVTLLYQHAEGSGYVELGPGARLHALRLIDAEPSSTSTSRHRLSVAARVVELAHGIVRLDRTLEQYAHLDDQPAFRALTIDSTIGESVAAQVHDAIKNQGGPLIAIIGAPGSGRRTLARNAVGRAGLPLLTVDSNTLPANADQLEHVLRVVFREALFFRAAVLFANFDWFINNDAPTRARILERAGLSMAVTPVLATMASDSSFRTERGFASVCIPPLRETDRLELWNEALGPHVDEHLAAALASRYQVTGGVIIAATERALTHARSQARSLTGDDIHNAIRGHVDATLGGLGTRVVTTQSWEDVILPDETLAEIREMIARLKYKQIVFDEWGFAKKLHRGLGLSALFHGPPGTGKTMVAGLIARELGLDLYQVDLSRVISKWVGETEKQLANVFAVAESGHTILLFDEADSLFSKRTDVKSSNDRYANLEVNYLLQRMESFSGITILTTNHTTAIDEAFRRRLSFRVEFPAPESEERERLWRAIIPREAQLAPDVDFCELAERYEMTGGYIRNAALRAAFFAAADATAIRREHLQRAATLEMASMGKVIGGRPNQM